MAEQIQHRKSLDEIFDNPQNDRKSLDETFSDESHTISKKPSMTVGEYLQKQEDQKSFIEKHHLNEPINIFVWIIIFIFAIVVMYIGYKIIRLIGKLYAKLDRWSEQDKIENQKQLKQQI